LLCLLIGGSGVGYVWQKDQIRRLGQQIKEREIHLAQLQEENEKRRKQLATLRSPAFLEARIKELNLGLVQPQLSQIWRLSEPPRELPAPAREPQYVIENEQLPARNE
jgi:transposase